MYHFLLALCLTLAIAQPARADAYVLDTGDALRISVPGETTYPVEVTVDDAGNIAIPLLGPLQARGHTTSSLAQQIKREFAEQDLILESFVHVEMQRYRPFFISGSVASAGAYPFNPGMTVRHAIAIAGGFRAMPLGETLPALRIADLRSERTDLLMEEFRHNLRLSRLRAEQNGDERFAPSRDIAPELSSQLVTDLIASEQSQLVARVEAFNQEMSFLEASLARAREDVRLAEDRRIERASSVASQTAQLETMRGLQEKGLATNTSVAAAERILNSYQIDLASAESAQTRAQQDAMTLETEIRRQREERHFDILSQIQAAHLEIGRTQSRLRFVTDKLLFLWSYGSHRSFDELRPSVRITIYREGDSGSVTLDATENTSLRAGDVIEIAIAASDRFYVPALPQEMHMPF